MRDMQTAGRVAPRPEPSPVILPPIAARPKIRCQTCRQEDPTKSDRKRQNPTRCYENSCAHAREATVFRFYTPRSQPQCARHANRRSRRSAPATVICHPTPNRSAPQETMPNSRSGGSDKIRQEATEYYAILRKLVPARTRARQRRSVFPFPRHGLRPGRSGFDVSHHSELLPPCSHANRPNGTPSSQLVACNSHVCYYFPSIGERRQT